MISEEMKKAINEGVAQMTHLELMKKLRDLTREYLELKMKEETGELSREYPDVSHHTIRSLMDHKYFGRGLSHGGFIKAVLNNDLVRSYGTADLENRAAMDSITKILYNDMPANSWQYEPEPADKVKNWAGLIHNYNQDNKDQINKRQDILDLIKETEKLIDEKKNLHKRVAKEIREEKAEKEDENIDTIIQD